MNLYQKGPLYPWIARPSAAAISLMEEGKSLAFSQTIRHFNPK
ncbi:hypothetical protein DBT_0692 [Dissulfuribacter thermophilus]|uniref:Uncharacterized protein n=1 Tax=Dissulfuribacter thermophilus TaxID=1156395 RepID=A0A1B9F752_9BACT|nr:hypothetical protein [Dissulfuribacter thermophilus]OCC15767.1 hypothetical protein DBT_0692 [Dissulfuribacter thermophilus]